MKKVLASKSNTRVNSKNLNPSTLIEDLSNNVHTENIALDAVMNVIELNSVSATLPAAKSGGESSQAEIVVVPGDGAAKNDAAKQDVSAIRVKISKRSAYDANSSDSEGDEFPPTSTIWTPEADNKLRSAHQLFGDDWSKIAAYLDIGQTGSQCMNRWHTYVNPALPLIVDGWTPADVEKLRGLIAHQQRGIVARKINWKVISAEMNREVASCQAKWRSVQGSHLHSGRFSAEEDDVIIEEVAKWGDRGHGLWKMIEKKLSRSAESIYKHYQKRLARRVPLPMMTAGNDSGDEGDDNVQQLQHQAYQPRKRTKKDPAATAATASAAASSEGEAVTQHQAISLQLSDSESDNDDDDASHRLVFEGSSSVGFKTGRKPAYQKKGGLTGCGIWTPEMDAKLMEAQRILGNDWVKVAEYCNNGQNNKQCGLRFNLYLDPKLKSKKQGPWTPEEIEQLKSLVVEFQSGGVGHKINWTTISRELNRDYNACKNKWKTVVGATMKRGPFTADEDELIIQRVQEWGTKGHGLWTALEKEMGRSLKFIFQRWKLSLQKQVELNALENSQGLN